MSWQQLASHFGNEGNNIRKFRQTVRDAWDRQVSAVYPGARADFGGGLIRLEQSPPPLRRAVLRGADLTLVKNAGRPALNAPPTDAESTPARFLRLLRGTLTAVEAKASWVRSNLEVQMARAALAAGLEALLTVIVRPK